MLIDTADIIATACRSQLWSSSKDWWDYINSDISMFEEEMWIRDVKEEQIKVQTCGVLEKLGCGRAEGNREGVK